MKNIQDGGSKYNAKCTGFVYIFYGFPEYIPTNY